MIQKFTLLLFTLFGLTESDAQSYHPLIKSNAFWTYTIFDETECIPMDPLNYRLHQSYYFQADSVINGHIYSQAYVNSELTCGTSEYDTSYYVPSYIFLREDTLAKKVFAYDPFLNVDTILYNFNAKVGDTLWSPYFTRLEFNEVTYVATIDSVHIGDFWHKRWLCKSSIGEQLGPPRIIEGIGSDHGLLNDYNGTIEFEDFNFDCYSENGRTLWPDTGAFCEVITGVPNIHSSKNSFAVFPNPVSDQFVIESPQSINASIEIYNSMGRLQYSKSQNFQKHISISTASWPAGLYEVVISNNGQSISSKILKQ